MASDKTPLLSDGDRSGGDGDVRRRQVKRLYDSDDSLRNGLTDESRVILVSPGDDVPRHVEVDRIVGVFTVAFDTRSGNVIEWCLPDDLDLDGVEFKAMTSGSHTLQRDFVYFRKGSLFGLACFENMKVESEIERGARMKSVGVLATSYTVLYRHMQFLETQVRNQLQNPGDYDKLIAFYADKKATLDTVDHSIRSLSPSHTKLDIFPELKITHPAGCFTQFFQFFGEQVFVLWKYVLLRKRILFCSPPPIGVVCYRVYCCCCLGNHGVNIHVSPESRLEPHFYVNVADIDTLETELSYIACTTEKIFGSKPQLWDVYIDNQNLRVADAVLKDLLKVNSADRDKQAQLNNLRTSRMFSIEEFGREDREAVDEEDLFTTFFTEQNNRLFQTLLDVSQSGDRTLTNDHMRDMGLDPVGDRTFIMELLETYGIDVILMVDNPCCPT